MNTRARSPSEQAALDQAKALVGAVIAGRWRVDAVLAMGGMASVLRGQHVHMKNRVAIKVLHPDVAGVEEHVARFEREAIVGANVRHANVASALDFGRVDDEGPHYLVLEYARGVPLHEIVKRGPVGIERSVAIARQIALGLGAAHESGVIHRDVKPRNIVVDESSGDHVKIVDFGLALLETGRVSTVPPPAGEERLSASGVLFGTIAYLAPEAAFGMDLVDERSDLYALGVILYEMLTGRHPFDATTDAQLFRQHRRQDPPPMAARAPDVDVPAALEALTVRLLHKDPDERHQTAADVVAALDAALESRPSGARLEPTAETTASRSRESAGVGDAPVAEPIAAVARAEPIEPAARSARAGPRSQARPPPPSRRLVATNVRRSIAALALAAGALVVWASSRGAGPSAAPMTPSPKPEPTGERPGREAPPQAEVPPAPAAAPASPTSARAGPEPAPAARIEALAAAVRDRDWDAGGGALLALAGTPALDDPKVRAAAREVAVGLAKADRPGAPAVFGALARSLGPGGLDVLYAIVESSGRSAPARRAQQLLSDADVLAQGTPALRLAFELRRASCDDRLDLLDRAVREGDERALVVLETLGRGCFPGSKRINNAVKALRGRLGR